MPLPNPNMATDGYPTQHGNVNGSHSTSANGARRRRARVLTVDEALSFSPFSSVVPFNTDIIPLPSVGLNSSSSFFSNSTERDEGRQYLDSLNVESLNTSEKLQKSLNTLKELLKPEGIAKFKFKTAPNLISAPNSTEQAKFNLSPFAQMVFDDTNVEFTYPSPERPSPPLAKNRNAPKKLKSPNQSKSLPNNSSVLNQQAHQRNSSISADLHVPGRISAAQDVTPSRPPPSKPVSSIEVRIPGLPANFRPEDYAQAQLPEEPFTAIAAQHQVRPSQSSNAQPPRHNLAQVTPPGAHAATQAELAPRTPVQPRAPTSTTTASNSKLKVEIAVPANFHPGDYEVLPDSPDTPQHLSKKRHRSDIEDGDDLSRNIDQREKADTTYRNLREFTQEIFQAQDYFQPDSSNSSHFFVTTSDGFSLSVATQTKLESILQKTILAGRFQQVPVDELLRLQKLCEEALRDAETIDIKINEDMGEAEVQIWLQQIPAVELGIKAARTSLRLMTGEHTDKQLYSEDIIQSAVNAFKNVTETCLVPIVEMRNSEASSVLFKLLSAEKKIIINLLTQCRRLLTIMESLVASIELTETVINTLEFASSRLIFVENAHFERDSVLGVSKFDGLRVAAMGVLSQIFLYNPGQRRGMFDEILTSLAKLPVTKQSARQFKLPEGGSIQLVSALIMRLIQTSASKSDDGKASRRRKALEAFDGDENTGESGENETANATVRLITSEHRAEQQSVTAIQELKESVTPLLEGTAMYNANYVISFIIHKAKDSTKSGESPYRNLLDLFVEDFIKCLNSLDWPAAELLLRLVMFQMVKLIEDNKTPAPAKNMALDLLGLMGAAISELNSHVRNTARSLENGDSDLGKYLSRLAEASLEKKASPIDLVSWACGPFRVCMEFLEERSAGDPQLSSAIGFFMAEWASKVYTTFDLISDDDHDHLEMEKEYGRMAYRLRMMISDRRWLSTEYNFDSVTQAHARLAYSITLLHSPFCASFGRILTILIKCMSSEQATVRSKALKSVNQVLDTDPTILDTEPIIIKQIFGCLKDDSVQVRDSALGLVGKCLTLKPNLEEQATILSILERVGDSGIGVRKRAMKLSKEIYLRNNNRGVRSLIAASLLHQVSDVDEGVQELARQTIEEVWMSPFYAITSSTDVSPQSKLAIAEHASLMVKTMRCGSSVSAIFHKVLQMLLTHQSRSTKANSKVCKVLVAALFESVIDNSPEGESDAPSRRDALQILTTFAKANAKLFTEDQIQLLEPYIANITPTDDLTICRSVVIIFRHALPRLSKSHRDFLINVRKELMLALSKMPKVILDDIIACLWIISQVLDDFNHLTRVMISSLVKIEALSKNETLKKAQSDSNEMKVLVRVLEITGMCGKHCDFGKQREMIKAKFPQLKDHSFSKLMVDFITPISLPTWPLWARKAAFDAIGMVCQSWPKNFSSVNVYTSFLQAFEEKDPVLEAIILKAFKEFLSLEEKRSEAGNEGQPGAANDPQAKLGVMGGGQGDGVALQIAQRFLAPIDCIARSRQDEHALLATEVIASIARQGLVHPKEIGSSLIALETSENTKIADLAYREHRALHEKHETILEKEYMRAVQYAYQYQRDVVQDTSGATPTPYTSKLSKMMEVLKISKPKNRKRFYDNLCARIEMNPAKMDAVADNLQLSRFIIQNLAFFEYCTVDELLSTITCMEKVVAATGTGIAHSIETEIFHVSLDQQSQVGDNGGLKPIENTINPQRLQQLTASSMVLSALWEARTHLRRQYGLLKNRPEGKSKAPVKDLNRAPIKALFMNGDKFWDEVDTIMAAGRTEESSIAQCRRFVELMSIDPEVKVAAEGEDDPEGLRMKTPSDDEENGSPGPPGSGRGRKRKAPSNTPGGRKKRARSSSAGPRPRSKPKGAANRRTSADRSDGEGDDWE